MEKSVDCCEIKLFQGFFAQGFPQKLWKSPVTKFCTNLANSPIFTKHLFVFDISPCRNPTGDRYSIIIVCFDVFCKWVGKVYALLIKLFYHSKISVSSCFLLNFFHNLLQFATSCAIIIMYNNDR